MVQYDIMSKIFKKRLFAISVNGLWVIINRNDRVSFHLRIYRFQILKVKTLEKQDAPYLLTWGEAWFKNLLNWGRKWVSFVFDTSSMAICAGFLTLKLYAGTENQ